MNDNFYNHKIVRMERRETSGNGQSGKKYPMWTCLLQSGEKVNVFQHERPDRNSYALFEAYHEEMDGMEMGDFSFWSQYPIECRCVPDGSWLKIVTVAPRPDGAKQDDDLDMTAEQTAARAGVQAWAQLVIEDKNVIFMDLEAADKMTSSEVLSIALIGQDFTLSSLVNPVAQYTNKAEHVNGLTAEKLKDAPTLADLYTDLMNALAGKVVAVYNDDFDVPLLQNALIRQGLKPIPMLASTCVMKKFAMYRGEWNHARQDWRWATLSEAAALLGIQIENAHDALDDTRTTRQIVAAMAAGQPLVSLEPF